MENLVSIKKTMQLTYRSEKAFIKKISSTLANLSKSTARLKRSKITVEHLYALRFYGQAELAI
jgi:hypothetical protein